MCEVTEATIERWIEKHDIKPYRDEAWLRQQIENHVSERAIADWCGVTPETIKRWMKRYEIDHPGLVSASLMESFLETRFGDGDAVPESVQISALWQRYRNRVQPGAIARAVGTTPQNVRQVVGAETGDVVSNMVDSIEFLGSEPVPTDVIEDVTSRDNGQCVRCTSTENTEIHHIIPGTATLENLATLCRDCHREAHEDDFYSSDLAYDSRANFWNTWVETKPDLSDSQD